LLLPCVSVAYIDHSGRAQSALGACLLHLYYLMTLTDTPCLLNRRNIFMCTLVTLAPQFPPVGKYVGGRKYNVAFVFTWFNDEESIADGIEANHML